MRFGVLGLLQVELGDRTLELGSPKQRRLLAALLVTPGRSVTTDRLIAALWGDRPPRSALASLRTYVHRLRDSLEDDGRALATTPSGYALQVAPDAVDAGLFERLVDAARSSPHDPERQLAHLTRALSLWRGSAFEELADEPFVRAEARRLEELRIGAEEECLSTLLRAGRHDEALSGLEAFVQRHPLRERAHRHLAVARYRAGHQAAALATVRELRSRLADELGLDPSDELERLERDLLRQAPWLDRAAPPATTRSPESVPPSLPAEGTDLLGRDDDLGRLRDALGTARVVTVAGVGGVGKTRLALRAAHEATAVGSTEVRWCELAAVDEPGEVASAVAAALDLRPTAAGPADTVIGALRDRAALLVIDNAEHVLDAVAALVEDIVAACPAVGVLVTSRAPLGLPIEHVHRLAPLAVDDGATEGDGWGPAVELLLRRARAVRPDLARDDGEGDRLVELCRRLDGLPLAIELAASRLATMNPSDLLARLDDRLDLVASTARPDDRHGGLRAVLEWSFRLLSAVERRLFARLSVFAGTFTLDAAESICTGDGIAPDEVAGLMGRLVEHSLVVVRPGGGPARYTLLETLRAYGRERLADAGEEETIRHRHARHLVTLARSAERDVRGRDEARGVAVLDAHLADLRAAHHWTVDRGEVELALDLVAPLFRYALWRLRGEVLRWAETAADLPGASTHPRFPTVAGMAGWGAGLRGDLGAADDWADRALAVVTADDPRSLAAREVRMHTALWSGRLDDCLDGAASAAELTDDPYELVPDYVPGLALTYAGRPDEALAHLASVQEAADRHGNPTMRALVRYARAEALLATAPEQAAGPLEEATELAREVDNRMVLGVADVSMIALLARDTGDRERALRTFADVIDRLRRAGDWTHLWTGLRSLVGLLAPVDPESSAMLLGAVRTATTAPPPYGEDARRLAAVRDDLEQALGRDALDAATARGRSMSDHEATDVAMTAIERALERP